MYTLGDSRHLQECVERLPRTCLLQLARHCRSFAVEELAQPRAARALSVLHIGFGSLLKCCTDSWSGWG